MDKKKNILAAAGLLADGADIDQIFTDRIRMKLVDLETGEYRSDIDATNYKQRKAAKDPDSSTRIPSDKDVAKIKGRQL